MHSWKTGALLLAGNICIAASVAFLIVPNDILSGGVAGFAIALFPIFHIPVVWMINFLTISLFLLGVVVLGRRFALRTLASAILYPVLVNLFSWMADTCFPAGTFVMEPWIASIYSGFLTGFGLGLVFRTGASTGGMDIPALVLHKYTHLSQGDSVRLVDGATVLLGVLTYGLQAALVGLFSVIASSRIIDEVLLAGAQKARNVFIISDKFLEVEEFLLKDVNRGVTELAGRGGYSGEDKPILMCCVAQAEYPELEEGVLEIDPGAFIIVNSVNGIRGEGFETPRSMV